MSKNEEIRKQLLETFRLELEDHLKTLTDGLLALEKSTAIGNEGELVAELFRSAHSLKGAARAVRIEDIEKLSHRLEDVLSAFKEGKIRRDSATFDILFSTLDTIREAMRKYLQGGSLEKEKLEGMLKVLEAVAKGEAGAAPDLRNLVSIESAPTDDEFVRVPTSKLDTIMEEAVELVSARMRLEQGLEELKSLRDLVTGWNKNWKKILPRYRTYQLKEDLPQDLAEIISFLDTNQENLSELHHRISSSIKELERNVGYLSIVHKSFDDRIRRLRMVPISTLFETLPRLVRDLARQCSKEATLELSGGEVEIDRKVIELIRDPLIHLIRNAVDHGLEPPELRLAQGKPRMGTIRVKAEQRGSNIFIEVSDDGAGIDPEAVKKAAIEKGIIKNHIQDHTRLIELIFHSGISTKEKPTEFSGRGIGLDVVRENLERIQGVVSVQSLPGKGTTFTLTFPSSLTTTRVLLVEIGDETFGIPISNIQALLYVDPASIGSFGGRAAVNFLGKSIPLVSLATLFNLPERISSRRIPVVVLGSVEKTCAFQVERFLNIAEIVVKTLGFPLKRVANIMGACILGEGRVIMVLNVVDLLKSSSLKKPLPYPEEKTREERPKKRVLVVDDSITTRTLVRSILESEGYDVLVAPDGGKAWSVVKAEPLDVVVTDIAMPVMDGFELTRRIKRKDKDLPVILVTSLESDEDRIRGLEAGADAYVRKSTFDQRELIEAIERLTDD